MFAVRYYNARSFASRYFPKIGATSIDAPGSATLTIAAPSVAVAITAPRVGFAIVAPSVTIEVEPL